MTLSDRIAAAPVEQTREIELQFDAPKGTRIHNRFLGVTVFTDAALWWGENDRRWGLFVGRTGVLSSHASCRTVKAFKRHLRKHSEALAGCEVVLCSRFVGHDVRAFVPPIAAAALKVKESENA